MREGFRRTYQVCAYCKRRGWYSRRIVGKHFTLHSMRCKYCGKREEKSIPHNAAAGNVV